ncbi:zinc finger protein 804A [Myotis myotis]|uniref:Zinc finger protein 804A n=1 Tax=Myotis myotis TaxID=51298 RepID=A0A7J7WK85_MYOMY|nr:zinc finger protein 804A [Myotis myotis]KAF6337726.1 zinc finger protein 804A [Myotis myotis]
MECYYIVISSTRLSNGHFRNIKGVFRGPLSKSGNRTLDYAEKENTIAKALEDLKANFYCELCDKQYHKHQEFDNHINSYDHAHKQRLKELKQREFARKVASKSRKEERKQAKALQRLHRLAELRKEAARAPGSGPMFKSTTVTVGDTRNGLPQGAIVDSVHNQEDVRCPWGPSEEPAEEVSAVAADPGSARHSAKTHQLGERAQGVQGHRTGFSFAFPKKASLRLESSAAAFAESSDDASLDRGLGRRSRFVPGPCHLQLPSPTDVLLSPEEKAPFLPPPEGTCHCTEKAPTQEMTEVACEKDTFLLPSPCQFQLPLSSDAGHCQSSGASADPAPPEDVAMNEDIPEGLADSESSGSRGAALDRAADRTALPAAPAESAQDDEAPAIEAETEPHGPERLAPSLSEEGTVTSRKTPDFSKRPCEPFVPVLNRDGSTVLQWPSEMLVYTTAQPPVSYSCNPLCFDFKSTKVNNHLEKNKPPCSGLCSQQKGGDVCKRPAWDGKGSAVTGPTGYDGGESRNEPAPVTPLLAEDSLSNGCDSGRNENIDQRYKHSSCRSRKTKRYHFIQKQTKQNTHEKCHKTRLKDTHEHRFHKSRRKKKRRKLCHHHRGEKAKESTTPFKMETGDSCTDTAKKNPLEAISDKRDLAKEPPLDAHPPPDEEPASAFLFLRENKETWKTWDAEYSHKDDISSKNHWTKNSAVLNGQSSPTMMHSGKCSLTPSRTSCSCKATVPSCGQDHGCVFLPKATRGVPPNQAVKRGYNSLVNETERCYRKRRPHSSSPSSDESLNAQHALPGEFGAPPRAPAPFAPRRRRRRKRGRFRPRRGALELRERADPPGKAASPIGQPGRLMSADTKEELNPQDMANVDRSSEQTDPVTHKLTSRPSSPLPSGSDGGAERVVAQAPSGSRPKVSNEPTSVPAAGTPAEEGVAGVRLGHQEGSQTVPIREKQVPPAEKTCQQPPPKALLCHHELAQALPQGKVAAAEASPEWLCLPSGILHAHPPLPFKEAQVSGHALVTTEQILAPLALPEQALLIPIETPDKFKALPCEVYQHILQPGLLAHKVKLAFPAAALAPPSTPLQPLPLQQPLSSTSVTTIHHTVLHHQTGTVKVLQPHQRFLSQVPSLTRTSLPQTAISRGPLGTRLCPGNPPTLVAPPPMPIIPASVLHPSPLAFPPLPQALFPSLLAPHPAVIPLQPLF